MWSPLPVLVSVSVVFHLMFVHYTSILGWVTEWSPFGARLTICSHCLLSICNIYLFPVFGFKSRIWLLIAPVPVRCFLLLSIYKAILSVLKD